MRRTIARAVAVLALITGIAVSTSAPADAAPTTLKAQQQVTARDWWF